MAKKKNKKSKNGGGELGQAISGIASFQIGGSAPGPKTTKQKQDKSAK
jgi:hypothetical protein